MKEAAATSKSICTSAVLHSGKNSQTHIREFQRILAEDTTAKLRKYTAKELKIIKCDLVSQLEPLQDDELPAVS